MLEEVLGEAIISLLKLLVAVSERLLTVIETAKEAPKSLPEGPIADGLSEGVLLLLTGLVASLLNDVPWVLPEGRLGLLVVEVVVTSDIESELLWVVKD